MMAQELPYWNGPPGQAQGCGIRCYLRSPELPFHFIATLRGNVEGSA
jgi:hypothetical protein